MENIFNNPEYYRKILLNKKDLIKIDKALYQGKSLICVFFTSYCNVGCPFCFFHSPIMRKNENIYNDIENKFNEIGINKFIKFVNTANCGYLQISGGGEPFLEKDAIIKVIEEVNVQRIILVTSGIWAYDIENCEKTLEELYTALKKNKNEIRLSIRVSISKFHSIKLNEKPLVNLLKLFEEKYSNDKNFTLQLKIFEDDTTIFEYLDNFFEGYKMELYGDNLSDDKEVIKIMPWKYKLTLSSGYSVIVGKSRIFNSNLRPNLYDKDNKINEAIYDMDLKLSQNDNSSIVYNRDGTKGLDWIVEYNGNVCTWQNRVQDNLLNIYEDSYDKILNSTLSDLLTYSYIEKGATYRNSIISEISKRTVSLMKSVNIRDYAGTLLFQDEKIRLYYNIRVLQDYIREKKINLNNLKYIPSELLDAIKMNKTELIDLYQKASYSVLDQELNKPVSISTFHDFLELIKLGHFELTNDQIDEAINYYNSLSNNNIKNINEIVTSNDICIERRLTKRVMNIKKLDCFSKIDKSVDFYLCRHGETNWNAENKIKGQLEDEDIKFTNTGIEQIKNLIDELKYEKIEAIFTSDMLRTKETSKILNEELNVPIYYVKDLRGLNMGDFQGLSMKEFLNDERVKKCFIDYSIPIPGGESINQLNERFINVLHNIILNYPYKKVAIISHGAAISNLKSYISNENYCDIDKCTIKYDDGKFNIINCGIYNK